MTWEAVSAIGTGVGALVVLVTGPLIFWQLVETQRATAASAFFTAIEQLQNESIRASRATVFALRGTRPKDWNEEQVAAVERVCHTYGTVGIMVQNGMLPKKLILQHWRLSLIEIWPIVRPLIAEYRLKRGDGVWANLEWLAFEAERFPSSNGAFSVPAGWNGSAANVTPHA